MKYIDRILALQENVIGMNERNYRLINRLNPHKYQRIAKDKSICKKLLGENGIPLPKTFCVIDSVRDIEKQLDSIIHVMDFVVKPAAGSGGKGVLILAKVDNNLWETSEGKFYDRDKLVKHISNILFGKFSSSTFDKAMIEYRVKPHPCFSQIYKAGLSDCRVIVLNGQPVMAMLRMPTDKSLGKANLKTGAIGLGIDLHKGRLTKGYNQATDEMVSRHPDSKVLFEGLLVPYWERVKEISVAVASVFPLNYLGVDLVFDEKLGPLVLDINSRPGMQIQNANATGLKKIINNEIIEEI